MRDDALFHFNHQTGGDQNLANMLCLFHFSFYSSITFHCSSYSGCQNSHTALLFVSPYISVL